MILTKPRDPRLVTIRRGGTLTDEHHHRLAPWAAASPEHVLHLFKEARPDDGRPRHAIEQARSPARGEIIMCQAHGTAFTANAAAKDAPGAARFAAYAAGRAASSA